MNKINDFGLFVFRVSIGAFMLFAHGLGKFERLLSGAEIKFYDPFGIGATASLTMAVFAEFFAAAFLMLGIFTRLSSFSLIITMFVAAFLFHADDPFGSKEKALMYLVSFTYLFIVGPGKFSIQKFLEKKIEKLNSRIRWILG